MQPATCQRSTHRLFIRHPECCTPGAIVFNPGIDLPRAAADRAILDVALAWAAAQVEVQLDRLATVRALQGQVVIHGAHRRMAGAPGDLAVAGLALLSTPRH